MVVADSSKVQEKLNRYLEETYIPFDRSKIQEAKIGTIWSLSPDHKIPCECEDLAKFYPAGEAVPVRPHPNCFCVIVPINKLTEATDYVAHNYVKGHHPNQYVKGHPKPEAAKEIATNDAYVKAANEAGALTKTAKETQNQHIFSLAINAQNEAYKIAYDAKYSILADMHKTQVIELAKLAKSAAGKEEVIAGKHVYKAGDKVIWTSSSGKEHIGYVNSDHLSPYQKKTLAKAKELQDTTQYVPVFEGGEIDAFNYPDLVPARRVKPFVEPVHEKIPDLGPSTTELRPIPDLHTAVFAPHQSVSEEQHKVAKLLDFGDYRETPGNTKDRIVTELSARLENNKTFKDWAMFGPFSPYKSEADFEAQAKKSIGKGDEEFKAFYYKTNISGLIYDAVNVLVRQWANTSADASRLSINMQRAVKEEFKLDDAVTEHFKTDKDTVSYNKASDDKDIPAMRAFARAVYDNTQDYLKKNNIESMTLYRGMNFESKGKVVKAGYPEPVENRGLVADKVVKVAQQPISSWAFTSTAAKSFAESYGEPWAVMIGAKVPVSRIYSTQWTGVGSKMEAEVVVLGGKDTVTADSYYGKPTDTY